MINANDFIFHSDFIYNDPKSKGYIDKVDALWGEEWLLTDGVGPSDVFYVFTEHTLPGELTITGSRWATQGDAYVRGGKLYFSGRPQAPGLRVDMRVHWRVYER